MNDLQGRSMMVQMLRKAASQALQGILVIIPSSSIVNRIFLLPFDPKSFQPGIHVSLNNGAFRLTLLTVWLRRIRAHQPIPLAL